MSLSLPGVVYRPVPQLIHLQTGIYGIIPSNNSQNVSVLLQLPVLAAVKQHITFQ